MAKYRLYASVLFEADSEEEAIEEGKEIFGSDYFDYVELENNNDDENDEKKEEIDYQIRKEL